MKQTNEKAKYSTQRVDIDTIEKIKTIGLHLARYGIRMRQSDIIENAFVYISKHEWEFIEFVTNKELKKAEGYFDTIARVTAKPWFPYGNLLK